jgi:hypothetical protein
LSTTPIPAALRRRIQERAHGRCEYCLLAEEDAYFSHEVDHIVSEKHGGDTILENLAWACFDCNRFKGSDIASLDRETGTLVPLYNPRLQFWSEHFRVSTGVIEALSQIGSVTERILRLNLPTRVEVRIELTLAGRYPT